jgi:hypothetical protein
LCQGPHYSAAAGTYVPAARPLLIHHQPPPPATLR